MTKLVATSEFKNRPFLQTCKMIIELATGKELQIGAMMIKLQCTPCLLKTEGIKPQH